MDWKEYGLLKPVTDSCLIVSMTVLQKHTRAAAYTQVNIAIILKNVINFTNRMGIMSLCREGLELRTQKNFVMMEVVQ